MHFTIYPVPGDRFPGSDRIIAGMWVMSDESNHERTCREFREGRRPNTRREQARGFRHAANTYRLVKPTTDEVADMFEQWAEESDAIADFEDEHGLWGSAADDRKRDQDAAPIGAWGILGHTTIDGELRNMLREQTEPSGSRSWRHARADGRPHYVEREPVDEFDAARRKRTEEALRARDEALRDCTPVDEPPSPVSALERAEDLALLKHAFEEEFDDPIDWPADDGEITAEDVRQCVESEVPPEATLRLHAINRDIVESTEVVPGPGLETLVVRDDLGRKLEISGLVWGPADPHWPWGISGAIDPGAEGIVSKGLLDADKTYLVIVVEHPDEAVRG